MVCEKNIKPDCAITQIKRTTAMEVTLRYEKETDNS